MARNEITGDVLSNHKGDKDLYDAGWDRIFGDKTKLGYANNWVQTPSLMTGLPKIGTGDYNNELMARAQRELLEAESDLVIFGGARAGGKSFGRDVPVEDIPYCCGVFGCMCCHD